MRIPDDTIAYARGAPRGEARIAANRIVGKTDEDTVLVVLVNAQGAAGLADIIRCACEHAPTPELRAAWKSLGVQFVGAALGAMAE